MFRRSVLALMPAADLGQHFDPQLGRPTKELYSMAALTLIMEFKNWTIDTAAEAYSYHNDLHYALNLARDHQYLCPRSLDTYRKLVREDKLVGDIFTQVTTKLIEELNISITKQRLDSTHLFSDMAVFGRTKLMATAVKRFLASLKRHAAASYNALDADLRERYEVSQARLFGEAGGSAEGRTQARQQVAQDMHALIERFADDTAINTRSSYRAMQRIFAEHCEIKLGKVSVRTKSCDAQGNSSHTMQNPSDDGAGYDGHKGSGYQVQLAQTSAESNPVQMITVCIPQSAGASDSAAVPQVIAAQQAMAAVPDEMSADTAYGSDANVEHSAAHGIDLISPVPGRRPKAEPDATAPTADQEASVAEVQASESASENATSGPSKAERTAQRRKREQSEEWRGKYRRRAGIESLNRGLDRVTGIKQLRVRGLVAVSHAVIGKACGWNILQAARAKAKAARAERKSGKSGSQKVWQALRAAWRRFDALVSPHLLASTARTRALMNPRPALQY
ncbi:MAG: transposase [Prosthecobacter sp.]|uniref:transposase n=1 Tax=Prosthecobacter sp. TaxID=1965333 RepID=UPI003903E9D1